MTQLASMTQKSSGFALKNVQIDLIRRKNDGLEEMAAADLELLRVQKPAIPASKYGLEVICGPSCETGAI